jgi:hypothetical protein
MKKPSVKGVLVLGAVAAVRRLVKSGKVTREAVETRLGAAAVEALDEKINVALWYPVEVFAELVELDFEIGGRRSPEYMREAGAAAARRLIASGMYPQMSPREPGAGAARGREDVLREARINGSLTQSLYNFIRTSAALNEREELEIAWEGARPFPEPARYSTEGFMAEMSRHQGGEARVTSRRPDPDRIVYTYQRG